jgi:hypothetical protein
MMRLLEQACQSERTRSDSVNCSEENIAGVAESPAILAPRLDGGRRVRSFRAINCGRHGVFHKHLALALLVAIGAAPARAQQPPPVSAGLPAGVTAQQRADFERGLLATAGSPLFRLIKDAFPSDYEAMIVELLRQAVASGGNRDVMTQAGFNAIRGFYKGRLSQIINAPSSYLNAENARELELLTALSRRDPALCHMYATTGFTAGTAVPPDVQPVMARVGTAIIDAAKAGVGRPVDPGRGILSQADAAAWLSKMRQLDSSEAMARFLSGQTAAADSDEGCRIGLKVYEAIAALPSEQSARITAYIIQSRLAASR